MSKNILIISGSSSIGNSLIKKFIEKKYNVVATFNKNTLSLTSKKLKKIELNILDQSSQNRFIQKIKDVNFSSIIILTGKIFGKNFKEMNLDNIKETFHINFIYPTDLLKKIIFNQKLKKNYRVIFLSSISSTQGSYDPYYASSKASLNMFIKCLSKDDLYKNMTICGIAPSLINNTNMFNTMTKNNIKKHVEKNPLKKLIEINDLSDFIFEISNPNKWSHLNGSVIDFNGGI
tara:strand:+ start:834 stop:1532 length:699 start_codon:yes stop_codon:yes gene_type:complete